MPDTRKSRATGDAYRWTCPICAGSGYATKARPASGAVDVLTSHIRATVGEGHGPRHEVPAGCDRLSLENHVETHER